MTAHRAGARNVNWKKTDSALVDDGTRWDEMSKLLFFHFLSFSFIFFHFLSFSFIFFPFLSFSFIFFLFSLMFFHFLSFSFIFFHFLSFSFIFFHFLSFSLSLLGAQNRYSCWLRPVLCPIAEDETSAHRHDARGDPRSDQRGLRTLQMPCGWKLVSGRA